MKRNSKNQIHLVFFYTEGSGLDNGSNLRFQANLMIEKAKQFFDSVIATCPRELIIQDPSWAKIFEDKRGWVRAELEKKSISLMWNQNWAALNFLIWKPTLIKHLFANNKIIRSGDIIFYHDINHEKYPEYLDNIELWGDYIQKQIQNCSVLLFNDNDMKIYQDTKQELILRYFDNKKYWKNFHHIWAGAFAIKKDDYGNEFLQEWLGMCSQVDNVSPITDFYAYPGYIWHSQEQACLSVLYHLKKGDRKIKCIFLWGSRRLPAALASTIEWSLHSIKNGYFKYIFLWASRKIPAALTPAAQYLLTSIKNYFSKRNDKR